MRTSQGAAVLVVVLVVAVPLVPAATVAAEPSVQATTEPGGNETAAYGMQVTAFMQSNAAAVNESVEDEMWVAAFEHANESRQARLATSRVARIDRRLDRVRQQRATLARQYANGSNGSLSRAAYVARATQLSARIVALQESIERTDRVAGDHVDQSRLRQIRSESDTLTGPPMAGVARGVATGPRATPGEVGQGNANGTRGPPGDRGNANGTRGPPGDQGNANGGNASNNGGDAASGDRGGQGNANGGSSDGNADGTDEGNDGKPGDSGGRGAGSNGQSGASDSDGPSGSGGPSSGDGGGES